MKECGNSKIHISSNFILSISLLITFDTLLLRPSLHCNTPLHFTTLHPTTLHYNSLHFTTLIDTSLPLIYTSLPSHLALRIYISYRSLAPHITKLVLATVAEDCCLVGHNAMQSGRNAPTFQKLYLPPLSGILMMEAAGSSNTSTYLYQTAWRCVTEEITLQGQRI